VAIEGAGARLAGFENAVRVLHIRNYRVYTAGNAISLIGSWMQRFSVGWLAWELSHSPTWLGIVAVADLMPTLLLSPLAGVLADRLDRVRLVGLTQILAMAQAALLALLTYSGAITIESLLALTLVLGIVNAVNQPARLALIPNLVDRASLPSAVAINALIFNGARFVGPALTGPIVYHGGVALAFALNSLTYLAFIAALTQVRLAPDAHPASARRHEFLSDTLAGYTYALHHPGIGPIIFLFAVTSLSIRGFVELFPGFADLVFGTGPIGLSWLVATLGLGAVTGGLWMVRRPSIQGLTSLIIWHVLLVALSVLGFTATANYWFALVCVFVCGFSLITTGISAQTLVQSTVDPAMRGRVMALYGMLFRGGPALNALILGWLASLFGLRLSVAAGAVVCVAYWTWARSRQGMMERALEAEARGAAE
jgi:MFS family permease